MTNAKATFETILENQNKLSESLTENLQEFSKLVQVDETLTSEGQAIWKAYMEKNKALVEENLKTENLEKGFEKLPEQYNKAVEVQMEFYNQTFDFYKRLMEKYAVQNQQEMVKQISTIYQKNMDALMEAANANMKVFQTYFQ